MRPFPGAIGWFWIHGVSILPRRSPFRVERPEIMHDTKMLPRLLGLQSGQKNRIPQTGILSMSSSVLLNACPTPCNLCTRQGNLRFPAWKNCTERANLRFPVWRNLTKRTSLRFPIWGGDCTSGCTEGAGCRCAFPSGGIAPGEQAYGFLPGRIKPSEQTCAFLPESQHPTEFQGLRCRPWRQQLRR